MIPGLFSIPIGIVVRFVIFAGGLYWCKGVLDKLHSDIDSLKESQDRYEKLAILIVWGVTPIVIYLVLSSAYVIIVFVKSRLV